MFSGKAEPPPLSEQELVIPSWRTGEVAASASASYRPSHRRNGSLPPRPQDKKQVDSHSHWHQHPTYDPACTCFRRLPPCRDAVTCRGPRGRPSGTTTSQTAQQAAVRARLSRRTNRPSSVLFRGLKTNQNPPRQRKSDSAPAPARLVSPDRGPGARR